MITDWNKNIKEGNEIHGFLLKRKTYLKKLNNYFYELEHIKTGAKYIHLENEDDNNLFSIAFKTNPQDSTGVAHILEHTALCGSRKYNVRDPFFSMIKRSLKTFMNALTASDWTMYPFSSQNQKDFYNLMDIYLDAAFYPNLLEINFRQEGHRLEFKEMDNVDSDLVIKGIVYNEMKGAMSSQASLMYRRLQQVLYPTTTYHHNSGGEPADIPKLSWGELKSFHKKHYHPSNSFMYSYGNLSLLEHLKRVDTEYLSQFEKIDPKTEVPNENRYDERKNFKFYYPLEKEEDDGKKCQYALSWLTCDVKNNLDVLALQLISEILLGNSSSPLRKKLLDSQLGKTLADTTGYEDDIKDTFFSVGLKGVGEKDFDEIEKLIFDSLKEIVQEKIEKDLIESALHQMELATREISGGHYPYSLNLLFRFFGPWIHGGDAINAIDFDSNLEELKEKITNENYLEFILEKYLINNPHCVGLALIPDSGMEEKEKNELNNELLNKKNSFSTERKNKLVQEAQELKQFQEAQEDLSCLPTLEIQDIPKKINYVSPFKEYSENNIQFYEQPTNGIFYLNLYFELNNLSIEDRRWLPLLCSTLTKNGIGNLNYSETSKLVSRYTGGFALSTGPQLNIHDDTQFKDLLSFGGSALNSNLDKFFELSEQFITSPTFNDLKWMNTLVQQRTSSLENSVASSGHGYALSLSKQNFLTSNWIDELYGGVKQVKFMKSISQNIEIDEINQKLSILVKKLFNKDSLRAIFVGDKSLFPKAKIKIDALKESLKKLESTKSEKIQMTSSAYIKELWLTTTPVSYVVRSYKTARYTDKDSAALYILANLLQSNYLHSEIREKGGAYGAMASYSADDGGFSFVSYRDPNLGKTFKIYDKVLEWALSGSFSNTDIKESILLACSKMDTPLSPASKAISDYTADNKGKTLNMRNEFRSNVLNVDKKILLAVAEKYFVGKESSDVAVTSEAIKRNEEEKFDFNKFEVKKI